MTSESENDEVEDPYNGYEQLPTDLVETNEESIEVTEDIQPTSSVFSEETVSQEIFFCYQPVYNLQVILG